MSFTFEKTSCHYPGENLILVGKYTGAKTVRTIEWYYEYRVAGNIIIEKNTCGQFGIPDSGYPSDRMTYSCNKTTNTYTATISNLDWSDEGEWGVIFSFTDSSPSQRSTSCFSLCAGKHFCMYYNLQYYKHTQCPRKHYILLKFEYKVQQFSSVDLRVLKITIICAKCALMHSHHCPF